MTASYSRTVSPPNTFDRDAFLQHQHAQQQLQQRSTFDPFADFPNGAGEAEFAPVGFTQPSSFNNELEFSPLPASSDPFTASGGGRGRKQGAFPFFEDDEDDAPFTEAEAFGHFPEGL